MSKTVKVFYSASTGSHICIPHVVMTRWSDTRCESLLLYFAQNQPHISLPGSEGKEFLKYLGEYWDEQLPR